jgi:hypothetical protein
MVLWRLANALLRVRHHAFKTPMDISRKLALCLAPLAGRGFHAVFAAFNPSRASTASRIRNFWILPVTVIGNSSTNSM